MPAKETTKKAALPYKLLPKISLILPSLAPTIAARPSAAIRTSTRCPGRFIIYEAITYSWYAVSSDSARKRCVNQKCGYLLLNSPIQLKNGAINSKILPSHEKHSSSYCYINCQWYRTISNSSKAANDATKIKASICLFKKYTKGTIRMGPMWKIFLLTASLL